MSKRNTRGLLDYRRAVRLLGVALVLIGSILTNILAIPGTAAAVSEDELFTKARYGALRECYNNDRMVDRLDTATYSVATNAIRPGAPAELVLPTGIGNSLEGPITCNQLFTGVYTGGFIGIGSTHRLVGLTEIPGKDLPTYQQLGYVKGAQGAAESPMQCVAIEYQYTAPGTTRVVTETTNRVCFPVDSNGYVNIVNTMTDVVTEDQPTETGKIKIGWVDAYYSISMSTNGREGPGSEPWGLGWPMSTPNMTMAQVKQQIETTLAENKDDDGEWVIGWIGDGFSTYTPTATNPVVKTTPYGNSTYNYATFDGGALSGAVAALRFFTGNSAAGYGDEAYYFQSADFIAMYKIYFQRLAAEYTQLRITSNCASTKDQFEAANQYAWFDGSQWCEISGVDSVSQAEVNAGHLYAGRSSRFTLKQMTFSDIMRDYMSMNFSTTPPEDLNPDVDTLTPSTPTTPSPGTTTAAEAAQCYEAAKSLGWILCPVISAVGTVTQQIYKSVEQDFLQVESTLYDTNSGTYQGWQNFRAFANTLFAIAFVIVILSQVTSIGISNYGIKKLLPRLIMVVLLVNLSFVICQLVVDVSNLLGSGLYQAFLDLPIGAATPWDLGDFVGTTISSLFTVGGGVALGYGLVVTWEFWLIPFLLALLGCVIGIIFFFIVLGVRKAGLLILIVLAPVAIVCYALPNTKSLFDKWKKMFVSLILVYPICGALMGGSQFASALLLHNGSSHGFFYALVAMLLSVVPFFFIPSIVRSSMAAMGNLGARISGLGQRFSGGLQRGIRNTDFVKEQQRQWDMRNAAKTANRFDRVRNEGGFFRRITGRGGRPLTRGEEHRRSAAIARYNRAAYEDIRAGGTQRLLRPGTPDYDSAMAKQRTSDLADQVAGYEAIYRNNPEMQTVPEMEVEYERLLTAGDANPEDIATEAQMRALQNVMMTRGDAGKDALHRGMMNHLGRLQQAGHSYAYDAASGRGERTGISMAAAHLATAHGNTFKNENKEMFNLINDMSERRYARAHEAGGFTDDGSGNFVSTYYRGRGAGGWKAETLAGSTEGAQRNLLHGVRSGAIRGQALANLSTMAREALRDERLSGTMNDDTKANLRQIVAAGMASDAQMWDPSATDYTATAGSQMAASMDAATLGEMAQHIDGLDMTDAVNQAQAQQMAENVYRALMNPNVTYDPEKTRAMQDVLRAANRQGIQRMVAHGMGPGARFSEIDQATLKLVHERPLAMPPAPEGYNPDGTWDAAGMGRAETADDKLAREEWMRERSRRQMYNQENGFGGGGGAP